MIECAKHSKLKKEIGYEGIQEHLEMALSQEELTELKKEQNRKIIQTEHEYRYAKEKSLKEHFEDYKTKDKRNRCILNALEDDYKQVEVARYLGISDSAVYKVVVAMSGKSGDS